MRVRVFRPEMKGLRLVTCAILATLAWGGEPRAAQPPLIPEVVVDGLDHPLGVAVQPQTGHVFVAEGAAGRVIRVADQETKAVLIGFPRATREANDSRKEVGPRGLLFLDRSTLAILGTGERGDGDPLVIASVPEPSDPPRTIEQALQLTVADANADRRWELHGATAVGSAVLCAITSTDGRSGVARFTIQNPAELGAAASYGPCELFATAAESAQHERFICLTISPRGELVVGQQIEREKPEGHIVFYRATDGSPLLRLDAHMPEPVALAYGPRRSGTAAPFLYALASHGTVAEDGGLYRLDAALVDGQLRVRPTKLAPLDHPTAMAWGTDGSLYVTILGRQVPNSEQPAGKLLRFPTGL